MTRYRSPLNVAEARVDEGAGLLTLRFESPERAIAPGQLVALYDTSSAEVLGAATIREAL
jgi:tRNA U34 2-thiouridine synthase MnmA/TrmU